MKYRNDALTRANNSVSSHLGSPAALKTHFFKLDVVSFATSFLRETRPSVLSLGTVLFLISEFCPAR